MSDRAAFDRRLGNARGLRSGLCFLAGLVWLCVALEWTGCVHSELTDRGVPLGLALLFVAIPCGLAGSAWLHRGRREPQVAARRVASVLSLLFLGLTWVAAGVFVALFAALVPLWPFTLREGPDTEFAREGFRRVFGRDPPPSVRELYYRVEGPRDPTFFLRCEGVEPALAIEAAARLQLEPTATRPSVLDAGERRPSWWPAEVPGVDASYSRGHETLWYCAADGLVLYRCATF